MKRVSWMLLLAVSALALPGQAEENKEIHDELRALRTGMIEAIDKADLDRMLSYMAPNIAVTWQDGTVSRGHDGVRDYYNRMMTGPNAVVKRFKTSVTVDQLTVLYNGDTGISFGTSTDSFELNNGLNFELTGRWSATLVKQGDRWLIANCHMSSNLFDNPLLNAAKRATYIAGAGTLVAGLLLGFMVGRKRKA